MLSTLGKKLFGSRNDRVVRRLRQSVERINAYEPEFERLSDEALWSKTSEFRERLDSGESLDDLLPEAFATVREASRRTLGLRHFDVQLIGGIVLHQGRIAEMKTGEGKTLVAPLAVYLNALTGKGAHVVTVNDYLARRDANWMGQLYRFLGLEVGVVAAGQPAEEKQAAYKADITYGTNNEFGFDYLRDNMALDPNERYQRGRHFAVIDEVDSVLIDEARTPLIISGQAEQSSELYQRMDGLVPRLSQQQEEEGPGDYYVDEKARQVFLTEEGQDTAEDLLREAGLLGAHDSLYEARNISLLHHLNAALRAHALFQRDVHYLVRDNQIVIVDEFTGRAMPGRRWSEGLHQAIEAKEGVSIQAENQTLASITFQNFFRMYDKLSGMTGTADTEAYEFQHIYGLEVVVIPTHMPMVRDDLNDLVYRTAQEKYDAIVADIKDCYERGQPVLVGTTSIENSELIADQLKQAKIPHEVLNAKQHEREAGIIARAGEPGAITIATNMAGRGTDIVLGGNLDAELADLAEDADAAQIEQVKDDWQERHDRVVAAGGLHVIGSERHESRRVDNQLRGRSGRQGDPGSTRFYLSLEDSLLRVFASERVSGLMQRLGMEEGEAIESGMVSRVIENAQRKVESQNFDMRKNILQYDDIANDQRRVVYQQRDELLESEDISATIDAMRSDVVDAIINEYVPPGSIEEQWDIAGLETALENELNSQLPVQQWLDEEDELDEAGMRQRILDRVTEAYRAKEEQLGSDVLREAEKWFLLQVIDSHWKDHLAAMDHLRQGIQWRGMAQRDPKQEYKKEAFQMFSQMLEGIKREAIQILSFVQARSEAEASEAEAQERHRRQQEAMSLDHPEATAAGDGEPDAGEAAQASGGEAQQPFVREGRKVGRNEPCPCGSGQKYKNCCGRLAG